MASLHIVLVEPEIPQNTGNIARTCAVTGASLHLVGPMGFTPTDSRLRHAGLDYWRFLSLSYPDNAYLFFGKESAGLPERLLFENPDRCVRIPMLDGARSLNLSNSVAIGVFEVLRQWDYPELECRGELRSYDWAAAKAAHPHSEFL